LSRKELRAINNYAFYDDPSRILRLIRFRVRLGFEVDERTQSQYDNVREAKLESKISSVALEQELRQVANEPLAGEVLKALEDAQIIHLFSPALTGAKLNLAGFQKLQKARQAFAGSAETMGNSYALFLFLLFEKLSSKERAQLIANASIPRTEVDAASRLEAKAAKVEKELASAKLPRPSALYAMLTKVPGELLLFLLMRSNQRLVIDRIKNYLQKYLPAAQEVSEKDVVGAEPGTPKFAKLYQKLVASRLDARPKKVVVEEAPPPPPPGASRRSASFGR
jgi:tRNA nucleotidyltransferase (CCA-adding enzyme)